MSAQFINLSGSGMPSLKTEVKLHNVDVIKSLQCDDSSCKGTVMAPHVAYQNGPSDNIKCYTPQDFHVFKESNPQTYQNLRQLYNQSSHIDNKPHIPMSHNAIAACTLVGLGTGVVLATYFKK
jgi:hypothetical protein